MVRASLLGVSFTGITDIGSLLGDSLSLTPYGTPCLGIHYYGLLGRDSSTLLPYWGVIHGDSLFGIPA